LAEFNIPKIVGVVLKPCCLNPEALNGGEKFFTEPGRDGNTPVGTFAECEADNSQDLCVMPTEIDCCDDTSALNDGKPAKGKTVTPPKEVCKDNAAACEFRCCLDPDSPNLKEPFHKSELETVEPSSFDANKQCIEHNKDVCKYNCCTDTKANNAFKKDGKENGEDFSNDPDKCKEDETKCEYDCCMDPDATNNGQGQTAAGEHFAVKKEQCKENNELCKYKCCMDENANNKFLKNGDGEDFTKDKDKKCVDDKTKCMYDCCMDEHAENNKKTAAGDDFPVKEEQCKENNELCKYKCCMDDEARNMFQTKKGESKRELCQSEEKDKVSEKCPCDEEDKSICEYNCCMDENALPEYSFSRGTTKMGNGGEKKRYTDKEHCKQHPDEESDWDCMYACCLIPGDANYGKDKKGTDRGEKCDKKEANPSFCGSLLYCPDQENTKNANNHYANNLNLEKDTVKDIVKDDTEGKFKDITLCKYDCCMFPNNPRYEMTKAQLEQWPTKEDGVVPGDALKISKEKEGLTADANCEKLDDRGIKLCEPLKCCMEEGNPKYLMTANSDKKHEKEECSEDAPEVCLRECCDKEGNPNHCKTKDGKGPFFLTGSQQCDPDKCIPVSRGKSDKDGPCDDDGKCCKEIPEDNKPSEPANYDPNCNGNKHWTHDPAECQYKCCDGDEEETITIGGKKEKISGDSVTNYKKTADDKEILVGECIPSAEVCKPKHKCCMEELLESQHLKSKEDHHEKKYTEEECIKDDEECDKVPCCLIDGHPNQYKFDKDKNALKPHFCNNELDEAEQHKHDVDLCGLLICCLDKRNNHYLLANEPSKEDTPQKYEDVHDHFKNFKDKDPTQADLNQLRTWQKKQGWHPKEAFLCDISDEGKKKGEEICEDPPEAASCGPCKDAVVNEKNEVVMTAIECWTCDDFRNIVLRAKSCEAQCPPVTSKPQNECCGAENPWGGSNGPQDTTSDGSSGLEEGRLGSSSNGADHLGSGSTGITHKFWCPSKNPPAEQHNLCCDGFCSPIGSTEQTTCCSKKNPAGGEEDLLNDLPTGVIERDNDVLLKLIEGGNWNPKYNAENKVTTSSHWWCPQKDSLQREKCCSGYCPPDMSSKNQCCEKHKYCPENTEKCCPNPFEAKKDCEELKKELEKKTLYEEKLKNEIIQRKIE
jgi:hypothetical protein